VPHRRKGRICRHPRLKVGKRHAATAEETERIAATSLFLKPLLGVVCSLLFLLLIPALSTPARRVGLGGHPNHLISIGGKVKVAKRKQGLTPIEGGDAS
jgi:hypothetical protein